MGDAVVGTGFSFNSGLNPYKYNAEYAAVKSNNNGNLTSYAEPMINLLTKQFEEHNIYDLIAELEINDDWSFSLPYDFVKKCDGIWETLKLMEGLKEPERGIVSYNYSMMAVYLVCNKKLTEMTYGGILLEWLIYPIIYRSAYSEKMENPKKFWDFCGEWLHEHTDWIDSMKRPGVRIDAEAEACLVLSKTIETIIKQKDDEADNFSVSLLC